MRNVLVERPFGRYMDKDFRDINSDTDLFDYMRGPLADAWFSADSVRAPLLPTARHAGRPH